MKKYKIDIIVIIVFVLIAGINWILINTIHFSQGDYVEISVDGKQEKLLPLDKDTVYEIKTKDFKNVIEIKNRQIYMKDADCPDKLCVKQGKISKNGESIICLPHKVVVKVIADGISAVDAHTN